MKPFSYRLKELLAQLDDMAAKRAEQRQRTAPVQAAMKHAKRLRDQIQYLPLEAYENPDIITSLDDVLNEFLYQSGDATAVATMLLAIAEGEAPSGEGQASDEEKARKKKAFDEKRVSLAKKLEPELGALGWLNIYRAPNFGGVRTDVLYRFLLTEYLRLHPAAEAKATRNENTGKYSGDFAKFTYKLVENDELTRKDAQSVLHRQWKPQTKKP